MSNKTFLKTMLIATLIFGGGSAFFAHADESSNSYEIAAKNAHEESVRNVAQSYEFEGTELDPSQLSAMITRSTTTDLSQAYDVTFSSSITGHTFRNLGGDKNVYVSITDPNYTGNEKVQVNESLRPIYTADAFRAIGVEKEHGDIVIPERLLSGRTFILDINRIADNFVDKDSVDNIKSIMIPTSIDTIGEHAFDNLEGKAVKFKVLAKEADAQFDASRFPSDAEIIWGYGTTEETKLTKDEEKILNETKLHVSTKQFPNGLDFMVGYSSDKAPYKDKELTLAYFLEGQNTPKFQKLKINHPANNYDAIGPESGLTETAQHINVRLNGDEKVDDNRVYFTNIYSAVRDENHMLVPDLSKQYYCHASVRALSKDSINDLVDVKFDSISTFAGYTSIDGIVNAKSTAEDPGLYGVVKKDMYSSNEEEIKNDNIRIRTRFTSLNEMSLNIVYIGENNQEKTLQYKFESRYSYYNLPDYGENSFNFLLKDSEVADDFNGNNIKHVELEGIYITLDLYDNENQRIVTQSPYTFRFGIIDFVPLSEDVVPTTNIDLIFIITMISYTVLFALASVGYFIYCKNAYKNDEFRRVNPKSFIKNAIIAFIGLGIVILSIMFIVFRFGTLDNSIVVYNPTDPYVVGFSVAALLVIGYYIRALVLSIKANMQKRKTEKLKLDEDVENDGTN